MLFSSTGNPGLSGTLVKMTDANGEVSFDDISLDVVGTGYKLVAISDGMASVESSTFDITTGGVSVLFVDVSAGPFTLGATFAPTVTALDAGGNTIAGFVDSVTIKLYSEDAAGAVITGTTTQTAVGGVATFSGISIDQVGTFNLEASSGVQIGCFSEAFSVTNLAQPDSITVQAPATARVGENFSIVVSLMQGSSAFED